MRVRSNLVFFSIIFCLGFAGCTLSHRGMLAENVYYSNRSPNIKIVVNKDFHYKKGGNGGYQHMFKNSKDHRLVYIHHQLHQPDQSQIDYYGNPEKWIYVSSDDIVDIQRYREETAGENWYVQDFVSHASTADCYLARKLSVFTSMHDVFHVLYMWHMPPYACENWYFTESLDDAQQQYLKEFGKGFMEDIQMQEYLEE